MSDFVTILDQNTVKCSNHLISDKQFKKDMMATLKYMKLRVLKITSSSRKICLLQKGRTVTEDLNLFHDGNILFFTVKNNLNSTETITMIMSNKVAMG